MDNLEKAKMYQAKVSLIENNIQDINISIDNLKLQIIKKPFTVFTNSLLLTIITMPAFIYYSHFLLKVDILTLATITSYFSYNIINLKKAINKIELNKKIETVIEIKELRKQELKKELFDAKANLRYYCKSTIYYSGNYNQSNNKVKKLIKKNKQ